MDRNGRRSGSVSEPRTKWDAIRQINVGQIVSAVLAVSFLGLLGYVVFFTDCDSDWKDRERVEQLERDAELHAEAIEKKDAEILKAREKAARAAAELARSRLDAEESERRLTAEIERLKRKRTEIVRVEREDLVEITELADIELAEKIQDQINREIEKRELTKLAVVAARPSGFVLDRFASEIVSGAFVSLESTRDQLAICEAETDKFEKLWHVQRNLNLDYEKVIDSQEELAERQAERLLVSDLLATNQQQRLDAYADRVSSLERSLFWSKWKTVIGVTVGVVGGIAIGKGVQ